MFKHLFYLTLIIALLIGSVVMVSIAPYHIYTLTLTEGIETKFLKMSPNTKRILDGKELDLGSTHSGQDDMLYAKFHFSHFELVLPENHSLYTAIPIIDGISTRPLLGFSFLNSKGAELFKFVVERPYRFTLRSDKQQLFELPIYNNYIKKKTSDDLWEDIFARKLSLPSNEGKSFLESLSYLRNVSYSELVYNLYVLHNRRFQIEQNVAEFGYLKEKNMGIVEMLHDDPKLLSEKIYIIENGFVYPVTIKTRRSDSNAVGLRKRFIREIKFRESDRDSGVALYARYQNLNYQQKISQVGMMYLFSAWSHNLDNGDYVRFIVQFLERGKSNLKYLKPFYDFAFRKFGTTFSGSKSQLIETATEGLKRKEAQQLSEDIEVEKERILNRNEENFNSAEERIKFNLNKAKENGILMDQTLLEE